MMGIGTDIVEIARVEAVWQRHAERFSNRILTPSELERLCETLEPSRFLAKRFAAKEAIAKCFGTGIGRQLSWQDLQIDRAPEGAPVVTLMPRALRLAQERGATRVILTLSDERAYAVAFAVLLA